MSFFRNHIVIQSISLFMALYVLNFSVDAPDSQPDHQVEDLSINDMESIVEIVLEGWMDIENAIPEHDESDGTKSTLVLKKTFDFCLFEFKRGNAYASDFLLRNRFLDYSRNFQQQFYPEFTPPPPKA